MANLWPATLPPKPQAGWNESADPNFVEFEVGAGPPKRRRRSTKERRFRNVSLEMSGAQITILDAFYTNTLEGGSLPFEWTNGNPLDDTTEQYLFVDKPSWRHWLQASDSDDRRYEVTLSLEVV